MINNKEKIETVYIEKIAHGGQGLGKLPGGKIIFVDRGYPGELVEVKIVREKKDYAIGYAHNILEKINERRSPACPYFGKCGGCQWMDINYEKQIEFKESIVKDQLNRIAKIPPEFVESIEKSSHEFEYRLKMEYAFDYKNEVFLGLKEKNSNKVIPLKNCPISPKVFNRALTVVPKIVEELKIPVYKNKRGILKHLVMRYSPSEGTVMAIFVTKTENLPFDKLIATQLIKHIPGISSVIHVMNSVDKIVLRGPYKVLKGEGVLSIEFDWEKFQIPPTAFFQNNYYITSKLIETITKRLELTGKEIVLDLYSGIGTFTMRLAALSKHVTAVENNRIAIKAGRANANINNLRNINFVIGDAEKFLENNPEKYDVIVLDPPRTGAGKNVINKILQSSPQKIAYVSCDPSTLARDLKILLDSQKYKLLFVKPFDMFPQTYHVESLALLKKK
ncbi:23S rRNA (uracil(1939)-C(5))-methyltransferase RlmD [Thermosipho ferrireducens]|uniref:23S rRNA (Uracil(1939)-C(5))-methyltransferase RlmD n=1 Tax=Thermosipho ferrireducens TaxID=2571116 RepID=A0ABX7S4R9_9BACT|nr:23S rRNA (uracil(1939)-C(5))-methyltransferase RlmD [Thermosipho ferrireducens]QTA37462.1 23S rRNA (uracil(1939)-C(5))-methyltransferase RlmD [Thermosipho ferrireducens]